MNVPQQSARRRQVYFDLPDTRVPERSSKSGRFDLETAASERPHFWFSSTSHAVVSCGDVMKVELSGEKGTPAWVLVSYFDSRAAVAAKAVIANVRHASCAFVDHEASYELRVARIRRLGSGSQASTLQWFSSFGDLESVVARKGGAVEASYFDCRAACRALEAHEQCVQMLSRLQTGGPLFSEAQEVH
mmetsp:Transcript_17073/g.36874  ORF Transcript_17073/g.36874 Transcript_17073/m.36874 type:complete len:189 (-) Transcript_17073:490-1056(-)